jgi:hypothetical protein
LFVHNDQNFGTDEDSGPDLTCLMTYVAMFFRSVPGRTILTPTRYRAGGRACHATHLECVVQ